MDTEQLIDNILDKRFVEHSKKEFEDYELKPVEISYKEWEKWEPTQDDIESIMTSIQYWSSVALPKGDKSTWNRLQTKIANECLKKELMLYESLGRAMRDDSFVKKINKKLIKDRFRQVMKEKSKHRHNAL